MSCNDGLNSGIIRLYDIFGQKEHIIKGELPIKIVRNVLPNNKIVDTIIYDPDLPFSGTLTLDSIDTNPTGASYKNGVTPLKGVQVVTADFSWTWTRDDESIDVIQEFENVALDSTVKAIQETGLTIEHTDGVSSDPAVEDRRFILEGVDGEVKQTLTKDIVFGNRIYYAEGLDTLDESGTISLLLGANGFSSIKTSALGFTVLPESLVSSVRLYVAVPADMGASVVFIDDSAPLSTNPMELAFANVSMTNGVIGTETYNIYRSKQGALRGASIRIVSV